MSTIDWPTIRAKYESGISQNSLAREYGISQQAISKRALKEGWVVQFVVPPTTSDNSQQPPDDVLSIIHTLLQKAAQHAQNELDIKDIKLLADALSQFHKIKLTSPDEKPTASGIDADLLPWLDMDQLNRISELHAEIDAILELARSKKLEQEQGIKTIRKQA